MASTSAPTGRRMQHRPRVLFICGSLNQTRQMHKIAQELPDWEAHYSPYYCDGLLEWFRKAGMLEFTILGWRRRKEALRYCRRAGLSVDYEGRTHAYDLTVTCSDVIVPRNARRSRLVAVQEGITDPENFWYWARRVFPFVPRWAAGTTWTGTSNAYDRFCVASQGYKDLFARRGADPDKMVVTGIPNFDDCAEYHANDFPHRDYVLVCTSDARETLKLDSRKRFLERALAIAAGRPLIFKLHPNEDWERAQREIAHMAPHARVYTTGSAEQMVANCAVLVCQYSTLAFVGLALGKEVHSHYRPEELARLLPVQNRSAAKLIAQVCRTVMDEAPAREPWQSGLATANLELSA
ncbi:MAG: hypothetical protein KA712_03615 [Myxococcales bacterium]|nr:hypothetical protein [Myxococcales bacterium]